MSSCSSKSSSGRARVVVAVDFGTTFSGFAYAKTSDPDDVFKVYEWPCASRAGAKPYSKTQTSLFYGPPAVPGAPFQLVDWGWSSLISYTQAAHSAESPSTPAPIKFLPHHILDSSLPILDHDPKCGPSELPNVLALPTELAEKVGFFATKFKLFLAPDADRSMPELPGGLTVEQMVVDYLHCLSSFVMSELRVNYGKHFSMGDVHWCLTVPAIWDERAKQVMKVCAEKAGMVQGASCPTFAAASPFPLDIILEPEAAGVYCQHKAKDFKLVQGDKILVADVGGGTIDLVVHQKADDDPESMRVHEVVGSYGEIGGGTFVDANFFKLLCRKIGCFKQFSRNNISVLLKVYEWWQGIKAGFDGEGFSAELLLPRKLSEAWQKYDHNLGLDCYDEDYYDELRLEDWEIKAIFDTEVKKVLSLIKRQVEGVRILMVVGGFSASPYMRKCIQRAFENSVEEVMIPEDPGSAICHGAVQMHMKKDIIQSRIAKRTYGIYCHRIMKHGDPSDLCYLNDDGDWYCADCISVFVAAGDQVPIGASFKKVFLPMDHQQQALGIMLVSSLNRDLKYLTEVDVVKEGRFSVDISEGMHLGKDRRVEITMVFGAAFIEVSAECANFGKAGKELALSVAFHKD